MFDDANPAVKIGTVSVSGTSLLGDKDVVTNSGTVLDQIWTGGGDDKITNLATGRILNSGIVFPNSGIDAGAGADTIINNGFVAGRLDAGGGADTITNTGTIAGSVYLGTDSSINTLTNSKIIGGGIWGEFNGVDVAAGGNNKITNSLGGVISGGIHLGAGTDEVINLGRIEGEIHLGGSIDKYTGNASDETVFDEGGGDTYNLGAGNDTVVYSIDYATAVEFGNNTIDGGAGVDTLDLSNLGATIGAVVDLSTSATDLNQDVIIGGDTETDTLKNFENVIGGQGADTITGSAGTNLLIGNGGNDQLTGGGGADYLTGGTGADTFIYTAITDSAPGLADVIFDFTAAEDFFNFNFLGTMTGSATQDFHTTASTATAEWRTSTVGGNTVLEINLDNDLAADMTIYLNGIVNLADTNFL